MSFADFTLENVRAYSNPARAYLWLVEIPDAPSSGRTGESNRSLSFHARKAQIPEVSSEEITIPWMNAEFYVAGKTKYGEATIEFEENTALEIRKILDSWRKLIYDEVGGGQAPPATYKRYIDITLMDADGNEIKTFRLVGAWPKTISAVELSYEENAVLKWSVAFRYDYYKMLSGELGE